MWGTAEQRAESALTTCGQDPNGGSWAGPCQCACRAVIRPRQRLRAAPGVVPDRADADAVAFRGDVRPAAQYCSGLCGDGLSSCGGVCPRRLRWLLRAWRDARNRLRWFAASWKDDPDSDDVRWSRVMCIPLRVPTSVRPGRRSTPPSSRCHPSCSVRPRATTMTDRIGPGGHRLFAGVRWVVSRRSPGRGGRRPGRCGLPHPARRRR